MQENPYPFKSKEWYKWTHEEAEKMHGIFLAWVASKANRIHSVLEIGCGLHDFYEKQFLEMGCTYLGLDHDGKVMDKRRLNQHSWRSGFIHRDIMSKAPVEPEKADLVFSRATIDHVSDPDLFVRQCIQAAHRYVYIMTYRPPLPIDKLEHRVEEGSDGYYYNDLAINQLHAVIDEFSVMTRTLEIVRTGRPEPEIQTELHIILEV